MNDSCRKLLTAINNSAERSEIQKLKLNAILKLNAMIVGDFPCKTRRVRPDRRPLLQSQVPFTLSDHIIAGLIS